MTDRLKKRSLFAFFATSFLIIFSFFIVTYFIQGQNNSGKTINIAGKQGMLIERITLFSHYYSKMKKDEFKRDILANLQELKKNHNYLHSIKNPIVDNIFYGQGYQYDYILDQFMTNVAKYIKTPTDKLLNIISFTSESILTSTNTLVTLLADDSDKQIKVLIYILVILTIFLLLSFYFIYRKITLVSILETEKNIVELDKQKTFMGTVLENSAHAIIATDLNGIITLFNKKAQQMLGYSAEEMVSHKTPETFHLKEEIVKKAKALSEEFKTNIKPGFGVFIEKSIRNMPNTGEWTYVAKNGSKIFVKLSVTALKDSNGAITGYIGIAEDITNIKKDELKMQEYVHLIDKNVISSSTDLNGIITDTSEAFCKISGYSKDELIGNSHSMVRHPDMSKELYQDIWDHLLRDKEWSGEIKNIKKNGDFYWVKANISPTYDIYGRKIGYTAIRQDITDKKLIEQISITDGLTDIYNRRHFDTIFPKMLKTSRRSKELICFLIMDVDHFKQYNDTYGHQMGDNVLIDIAKTLKESLKRQDDFCFRLGGEEFGVVFHADSKEEAFNFTKQIKQSIENLCIEHSKNSASKYVTASMGLICVKPDDVKNEDEIYREADDLLYKAKEQGRNTIVVKD